MAYYFHISSGIDIEAGCGQLTTELMKRRKPTSTSTSTTDAESDLVIQSILETTMSSDLAATGEDFILDKSFISLDVENERQITFADIENAP